MTLTPTFGWLIISGGGTKGNRLIDCHATILPQQATLWPDAPPPALAPNMQSVEEFPTLGGPPLSYVCLLSFRGFIGLFYKPFGHNSH